MKPWILALGLLLAACSAPEEPPPDAPPGGRAETQSIRNTDAVGYEGKAVADKVDQALDKNDEQVKKTAQEAEASD